MNSTSSNPYASPETGSTPETIAPDAGLMAIAKPVFKSWEVLRLAYVAFLGIVTLLPTGKRILEPQVFILVAVGAVVTNVCFFAGPVVETYVRWLGYREMWVRAFLFIGGSILTAIAAVASLLSIMMPDF